jgi:outer membrane protein
MRSTAFDGLRRWNGPGVSGLAAAVALAFFGVTSLHAQNLQDAHDAAARAGVAEELVISLDEAVDRALRNSPLVEQRAGAVRTAASGERTAFGSFLPNLSLTSGTSLASTERFDPNTATTVTGSNDSYSAGLSASMDLFTAGRRGAQLNQARAQTDAAEAALLEQHFNVALIAKRAFFDVLRTDETLRIAESRVERAQQVLAAAENRVRVGTATRSDELRAQLELNQARQALLQSQTQRRNAAFTLGATVGMDGPVGARLDHALEPTPLGVSREAIVDMAIGNAPGVLAAEASLLANEAGVRASRTQYFPTLRVSSGYDWFNQERSFVDGRTSWNVRFSLNYPIFNGFAREDAIERAQVQARVGRVQLEDARRQARANAERAYAALELAEQQIALAEEAVAVSTEDMRVQQERYRLGVSTILEQVTSQISLAEAELNLIAARYDYQLARAELEALLGRNL